MLKKIIHAFLSLFGGAKGAPETGLRAELVAADGSRRVARFKRDRKSGRMTVEHVCECVEGRSI